MNLSNESLLVIVLVGIVAGWAAGKVVDERQLGSQVVTVPPVSSR